MIMRRLQVSYLLGALVVFFCSGLGFVRLRALLDEKDAILSDEAQDLIHAQKLRAASERIARKSRSFLLLGEQRLLDDLAAARREFLEESDLLQERIRTEEGKRLLYRVDEEYSALKKLTD